MKEQMPSIIKMKLAGQIEEGELEALRRSPANPKFSDGPTIGDWEKREILKFVKKTDDQTGNIYYNIESLGDAEADVKDSISNFKKTTSKGNS